MSKKIILSCDRCGQPIEGEPAFSGKLPAVEKRVLGFKMNGEDRETTDEIIGILDRDLCIECRSSFMGWWKQGKEQSA